MSATKRYREQHDDMLSIASEISAHLNVDKLSNDANEVRSLLSKLLGKLGVHLAMEDKTLYPKLLDHPDESVKSMAKRFSDEMGGIGEAINAYKNAWPHPIAIQNDPSSFIEQTKGIFDALSKRIDRENNELYKIVDQL